MDVQVVASAAGLGTCVVGVLLYIVRAQTVEDITRLDGRIDTHEAVCAADKKHGDEWRRDIKEQLSRIEQKLDDR